VPVAVVVRLCSAEIQSVFAEEASPRKSTRIIQYRGPMPLLRRELWGSKVELRFELYRSPEGGTPFWRETPSVMVSTNGWVQLDLGEVEPLPDEAFNTPFRFLSIWHQQIEFGPRKQVVSLAYVASAAELNILSTNFTTLRSEASASNELRIGALVGCGLYSLEGEPRSPKSWLEASQMASQLGARLPTFEEWYGAHEGRSSNQLSSMTGHYEWVIPWVYEPTIHWRLHELYRGKTVACYYEELSPQNRYPFRLALDKPVTP